MRGAGTPIVGHGARGSGSLIIGAVALALAGCAGSAVPGADAPKAAAAAPRCVDAPKTLVTEDLAPGSGDPITFRTAVLVGYTGWLYDACAPDRKGAMFDTSQGRPTPFGLVVGAGRVIKGWDEGLIGMREGGKRRLVIPPDKGYGSEAAPGGKIPPNSTLVFEVEIIKVLQRPEAAK